MRNGKTMNSSSGLPPSAVLCWAREARLRLKQRQAESRLAITVENYNCRLFRYDTINHTLYLISTGGLQPSPFWPLVGTKLLFSPGIWEGIDLCALKLASFLSFLFSLFLAMHSVWYCLEKEL